MSQPAMAKTRARPLVRAMALLQSGLIALWPTLGSAGSAQPQSPGNNIVTDGRTQTSVQVHGNSTNITTTTIQGGNAYNSFSHFTEGAGNTVNLQVPSTSQNLINIVRDSPVTINGTLNGYKNGSIGGNVYFADPYGMVVGKSGSINVGTLGVSTPTKQFLDTVIDPNGNINGAAASQLMRGQVPISPRGAVAVRGVINARFGVNISGQSVVVSGPSRGATAHDVLFAATVNTGNLGRGGRIIAKNGSIAISAVSNVNVAGTLYAGGSKHRAGKIEIAAGQDVKIKATGRLTARSKTIDPATTAQIDIAAGRDVRIDGQLTANGRAGRNAGSIDVTSGRDLGVGATAKLSAAGAGGNSNGGTVALKSAGNLSAADHAIVSTAAGSSGNAGNVELSAAGTFKIGAIIVDVAAPHGTAGTLIIDPADIIVGDSALDSADAGNPAFMSNATVANMVAALGGTGTLLLTADNSITIDPHGVIDTRLLDQFGNSNGNSENIKLVAPLIDVMAGGELIANIVSPGPNAAGYTAGTITLDATGAPTGAITIAGRLAGGAISLMAGASITLASTAVLDTTVLDPTGSFSLGNSQNVSLVAPTITTAAGSQILASVINENQTSFTAGNITFDATGSAAGAIEVAGTLSAGNVSLMAGSRIAVDASAVIDASQLSGQSDVATYGTIALSAPTISVAAGAQFFAQTVNYDINQSAVVIGDPTADAADANLPGFIANGTIANYVAALGGMGTFALAANNAITIDPHGVIDARNLDTSLLGSGLSVANSAGILLTAPTIDVKAGGQLLANVDNDLVNNLIFAPGDVTLTALGAAGSGIAIAGTIRGGNVVLTTDLTPISVAATGIIDTRQLNAAGYSTGIPLDITLAGNSISVAGQLLANAVDISGTNGTAYLPGNITLSSQNITVANTAALTAGIVTFQTNRSDVFIGAPGDANSGSPGFLSNGTVASYLAASLSVSSTFVLTAGNSISVDGGGTVDGGATINIDLAAPTLNLAAGSSIAGNIIALNAGTININAAANGGAQIFAETGLQLTAAQVNLTSTSVMIVGAGTDANLAAAGFVNNTAIGGYAAAMNGSGTLGLAASTSITVDPSGIVDGRRLSAGVSSGNSVNLAFTAPTIDIAALGQVRAEAVNQNGTSYAPGSVTMTALGGSGITIAGIVKGGNVSLATDLQAIAIAATGVIDARQLDQNSHPTGQPLTITLSAPAITVANGAKLNGGAVDFAFTESALTVGTAGDSGSGSAGFLLNSTIASYIAALGNSGTFRLSAAGSITLDADAFINAGSAIDVALSAPVLTIAPGAQIIAASAGFELDQNDVIVGTSSDTADAGKSGFVSNSQIAALISAVSGSGTFSISANDSITIDADGVIDGRQLNGSGNSVGNSVSIALDAPSIAVLGTIETNVVNVNGTTYVPGAITLNSSAPVYAMNPGIVVSGKLVGGATTLTANTSITLAATGVIETDQVNSSGKSTLAAQDVSLTAPSITLASGSVILAQAVNTAGTSFTNGNVTITAGKSDTEPMGLATATAGIAIAGTIKGGNITVASSASAIASYDDSAVAIVELVGQSVLAALLGLNGGYVGGTGTATVALLTGADINGSGSVTLSSTGTETAEDPALVVSLLSPVAAAVTIGEISSTVSTTIASGASVTAGGNLTVSAQNSAKLAVDAVTMSSSAALFAATVAYGSASVATTAAVASGATLSGGQVDVSAYNSNSFSVDASTTSFGGAIAGFALALSDVHTSATATLGANVGTTAAKVGNVTVEATSSTAKNVTSASTATGQSKLIGGVKSGVSKVGGALSKALGIAQKSGGTSGGGKSTVPIKFAGAVTYAQSGQSATAGIAASTPGAKAPTIMSNGSVAVIASLSDDGVRDNASSATASNKDDPSASDPQAKVAIAAGVAIGEYDHDSNAYIGPNAVIDALRIGVSATTSLPISNSWTDWDGVSQVLSHINGTLGGVADLLTSYADATSAAQNLAISGSLGYFNVQNDTTAWVGSGAKLTATDTGATNWTTVSTNAGTITWASGVTVTASTSTQSIDIAGNVSLPFLNGAGGQGSDSIAVGGAANVDVFQTTTIAGIGDGAVVVASGGLAVSASTNDLVFDIAPTAGAGAKLGFAGITTVELIDNTTHASISDLAQITAPSVAVTADQGMSVLSIAGAVVSASNVGVGLALALSIVDTDTAAYVGANSTDITTNNHSADDTQDGTLSDLAQGTITTGTLVVAATTYGTMTSVGVAATLLAPADPAKSIADKGAALPGAVFTAPSLGALDNVFGTAATAAQAADDAEPPKFTLDVAGSASATDSQFGTRAYVDNEKATSTGSGTVKVEALDNTIVANGSGAAALNWSGNGAGFNGAVAAAVAVGLSDNTTSAAISGSTLTNMDSVAVQALSGGTFTVIGLALAVSNAKTTAQSFAGSISLAEVTDNVSASIINSQLTGTSAAGSRSIDVDAYQSTDVGIGAGSLYVTKASTNAPSAGAGFALTYVSITDPTDQASVSAQVTNSSISAYDSLTVAALDVSVIGSGAAAAGGGPNSADLGGAVVVNDISPTITASIGGSAASPQTIHVAGDISVTAAGAPNSDFNTVLAAVATATNAGVAPVNNSEVDFSAAAVDANMSPGAAIVGVAGMVQFGAANVGFSLVINTIDQSHSATIDDALLTSDSGDIGVYATDNSTILGIAFGVGNSDGGLAGVGSVVVNKITNSVTAMIGGTDATSGTGGTTVNTRASATNVTVQATDGSSITGAAGALAFSQKGGAIGLSVVADTIGNTVTASIEGAKVATSQDVMVQGTSTATILNVAVGAAIGQAAASAGLSGAVTTGIETTGVTAEIYGGADVDATGNVGVIASNQDTISVLAATVASGQAGAGGLAVVVSSITGATSAAISGATTYVDAQGGGSQSLKVNDGTLATPFDVGTVQAPTLDTPDMTENQVSVTGLAVVATSTQAVVADAVSAGLAFGTAGSAVVVVPVANVMGGSTTAYIDGANVDTRLVAQPAAAALPQIDVNASSYSYAGNFVAAVAFSNQGMAGAAAAAGNGMSRETDAYITGANVGTSLATSTSTSTTQLQAGTGGGTSGTVDGSGAAALTATDTTTTTTFVPLLGSVTVTATSAQDASDIVVGGAASGDASGAASIIVNVFSAGTKAYVDQGILRATSLSVTANSKDGYFAAAGAGAISGDVGVAGAFIVGVSGDTTTATIGDASKVTVLALSGALTDTATSAHGIKTDAVSGALGGEGAGAAMADIMIVTATTTAEMHDVSLGQNPASAATTSATTTDAQGNTTTTTTNDYTDPSVNPDGLFSTPAGAVTVQATETTNISSASGSGAAGLYAGVGAGATVVMFASAVQAAIDDGSIVNSSGNVALTATGNTAISATSVTAGAAIGLGIGAAAGVIIVGSAPPSDALSVLNQGGSGTLSSVNSSANTAPSNGVEAGVPGTATTPKATSYDVTDEVTNGGSAITKASVDGSTITANSVIATAGAQMSTTDLVVGVGLGIGAGGAAVGYTRIDEAVTATIGGTITASTVSAMATMDNGSNGNAATVNAYAGTGALGLPIGAAVADARIDNAVTASVGGTITGSGANNLTISAEDSTVIATDAFGATAAGGVALGVSLAFSQKSSQITAAILTGSNIAGFTAIALTATATGSVTASATAGVGGAGLAADGAAATATDEATITAEVGDPTLAPTSDGITIALGSGGITLNASATPDASANAYGVAVAGVAALGASVAIATAEPDVQAVIADGTVMTGIGGASLEALSAVPVGGTSANAQSFGAAGGVVLGVDATIATATGNATVNAAIGNNVTLPDGDVAVSATGATSQYAYADGVAAGGLLAAGASIATAQSTGNTTASLGYGVVTDAWRIGALAISASGSDSNTASAVAGSGALISGGASQATTSDTATTSATIADNAALTTIFAGDVTVASSHDAEFSSDANSIAAFLGGFSGAFANDNVSSTVTSSIGQYVKIDSAGSIHVTATNTTDNGGSSVTSGSGGVLVGSAVAVNTTITENAYVDIGASAVLSVNGDPAISPGLIDLQASNFLNAGGSATLNAGGAAVGGDAQENLTANLTNNVTIGQNVTLFNIGGIQIGTYSHDTLNNGSEAHLYAAISGGGAESSATVNLNQTIDVGQNDKLEAYGLINIAAGESGDGSYENTLVANSNTDVYNEALIPITGEARGTAAINDYNTVKIEPGSQVLGVSNVTIGAYEGSEAASGSGSSHNPYLSIFNATVHDDHSPTKDSALVVLDGAVTAGIHYQQLINIAADGTVTRGDASDNALSQVSGNVLYTYLTSDSNVLVYNVNNNDFPQQDVQAEINYLKSLPQTDAVQAELVNFEAQLLAVAAGPVSVITFGGVLASGGDVTIRADQLQTTTGASVLTANGAPTIDIENNSAAYLVLTALTIPTNFGGHVNFTGAGTDQTIVYTGSAAAPATLIKRAPGDTVDLPQIIINNNNPVNISTSDLAHAPANPSQIYLEGDVSNLNGSVSIFNKFGSMWDPLESTCRHASLSIL